MRLPKTLPIQLDQLGPRQGDIMRVVYAGGGATAREVYALIPDAPPSRCGVRTLLNRLVRRGLLKTRRSGRHREIIYLPAAVNDDVRLRAFDRIAKEHFRGSKYRAAEALSKLASSQRRAGEAVIGRRAA